MLVIRQGMRAPTSDTSPRITLMSRGSSSRPVRHRKRPRFLGAELTILKGQGWERDHSSQCPHASPGRALAFDYTGLFEAAIYRKVYRPDVRTVEHSCGAPSSFMSCSGAVRFGSSLDIFSG